MGYHGFLWDVNGIVEFFAKILGSFLEILKHQMIKNNFLA